MWYFLYINKTHTQKKENKNIDRKEINLRKSKNERKLTYYLQSGKNKKNI